MGNGFVLLTPFGEKPWTEAAKYLATEYPLHLKTLMIDDGELMSADHLDEAGAVLSVRTAMSDGAAARRRAILR